MNAASRLFLINSRAARAARLGACLAAGALLTGCVANPFATAKVDPSSPIAADVAKAADAKRPFPKFTDIPPLPTDVRPPQAYGASAKKIETARDQLVTDTAENTWTLNETTTFAANAETAAGPAIAPSVQDRAATEALAQRLRERATPPPRSN